MLGLLKLLILKDNKADIALEYIGAKDTAIINRGSQKPLMDRGYRSVVIVEMLFFNPSYFVFILRIFQLEFFRNAIQILSLWLAFPTRHILPGRPIELRLSTSDKLCFG